MKGLKQVRIRRGLTLEELATGMNVTLKTIYNYESGKREPSFEMLKKLAAYFNCTIDELM